MEDIDLLEHGKRIAEIVGKHIVAKVEIVDDVAKRFAEMSSNYNAQDLSNPIGKALWRSNTEPDRILLRRNLSGNDIENHVLALFLRGFRDVYEKLEHAEDFVFHLVLHEVAHIKNDWDQTRENDCDKWAFQQLEVLKNGT